MPSPTTATSSRLALPPCSAQAIEETPRDARSARDPRVYPPPDSGLAATLDLLQALALTGLLLWIAPMLRTCDVRQLSQS